MDSTKTMGDKVYTGVGSRKAPDKILKLAENIANKLSLIGYTLRSGGADGMDKAFEKGASKKRIYYASDATLASMIIAEKFHPAWSSMKSYGKMLHGRNSFQVLGDDLNTLSEFLICWTPDGCICHQDRSIKTGGTGTAISIANYFGVKVFNLKRDDHKKKIENWIKQ